MVKTSKAQGVNMKKTLFNKITNKIFLSSFNYETINLAKLYRYSNEDRAHIIDKKRFEKLKISLGHR